MINAMKITDYAINLLLSLVLIVGVYQFYFWCQRNHLAAPRELKLRIDDWIPYWPSWVWVYSCIYYPIILYLNFIIDSAHHFTHVATSYVLLLGLQMLFFVLFPVTTPAHWRGYNRERGLSERFLALVQRFAPRSDGFRLPGADRAFLPFYQAALRDRLAGRGVAGMVNLRRVPRAILMPRRK
jgi:hypothetical protein